MNAIQISPVPNRRQAATALLATALLGMVVVGCGGLETEGNEAGRFTESQPADGTTGVPVTTSIVLVFSEAVKDESAAAQATSGPCADKPLQLTSDGFKTCIAAVASIVPS